ncbi:hypothetical protein [Vulcanisaeta distributa]|uniref:Uncharacterized protein n=1 Tax=Vulcanisaeta distributa (strain DSM 14429 / JCM 11212 / NBRC 100878 / IC-017) TaxID=572478 RepID=E1QUW3_VULDI|nr:hypothetical protein [Vulcanisaeta distributa]ADN49966.1 hypothetical protein Vdis_0569 [Vulcanisaeta distributa DSM 14429]
MDGKNGIKGQTPDDAVGKPTADELKPHRLGVYGGDTESGEGRGDKPTRLPMLREGHAADWGPAIRICWGVKVKGKRRPRCGEEVSDVRVIEEVMKLINEFLDRVERHRDVLLGESTTPFDKAINDLNGWLMAMEEKAKESNDPTTTELRKAMIDIGRKMLQLARQARKKWLTAYRKELEELIEKLRRGEIMIIVRGEALNKNKSFGIYFYARNITIIISKVANSNSVIIHTVLVGLRGTDIVIPRLFGDDVLKPMRYGLMMTDGSIDKRGYLVMNTNQLWQSVMWILTWPGRNAMCIASMNLNETNVNIKWRLTAVDHRNEVESKTKVAEEVSKLSDEEFLTFLLFTIFGDGDINVGVKRIGLTIGDLKHELWRGIIERIKNLGFKDHNNRNTKEYMIHSSKAVELARKWLSNALIRVMIEDLSSLPDAEKLRRLVALASAKVKPRGRSSVEVAGVRMNVRVGNNRVELVIMRSRLEDAETILKKLRNAGYNAKLSKRNKNFAVYINNDEIKKYPELVAKVCEVLRRMHEEAVNEGKTERAWRVAKAMANLNCPAQGPRAQ